MYSIILVSGHSTQSQFVMMTMMTVMLKGADLSRDTLLPPNSEGQQPQLPQDDVDMYRQPTNDQTHLIAYNSILVFWFWVSSALYYTPLLIKFFFFCVFYVCMLVCTCTGCLFI